MCLAVDNLYPCVYPYFKIRIISYDNLFLNSTHQFFESTSFMISISKTKALLDHPAKLFLYVLESLIHHE